MRVHRRRFETCKAVIKTAMPTLLIFFQVDTATAFDSLQTQVAVRRFADGKPEEKSIEVWDISCWEKQCSVKSVRFAGITGIGVLNLFDYELKSNQARQKVKSIDYKTRTVTFSIEDGLTLLECRLVCNKWAHGAKEFKCTGIEDTPPGEKAATIEYRAIQGKSDLKNEIISTEITGVYQ